MTDAQRTLKQMILEGLYVVDERSVAGAIVARARARIAVAQTSFRSDPAQGKARRPVFARSPSASSFGLDEHSAQGA